MNKPPIKYRRLAIAVIISLLVIGIIIVALSGKEALNIVERADWGFVTFALVASTIALLFQCYSYVIINRAFGVNAGFLNLLGIGFASITIGNVVSTPFSLTEFSIRTALLVPQGFKFGDVAAASALHSYIKDMAILILAPATIIYQIMSENLSSTAVHVLIIIVALAAGALLLITFLFISKSFRDFFLGGINKLWHFITRQSAQKQFDDFDFAIEQIKVKLRENPQLGLYLLGLMFGDWIFTLLSFELCFLAFGMVIPFTILVSAFTVGKTATILSFIPGGIGVRSTSTAGALTLFHINFDVALLVVVLYRIVYDFIPYFASFVILRFLLKKLSPAK
jgi:uncharacterized protein (TIRG00374 family)